MNRKPAYLTLLLALLHGGAGITILVIASWFIAVSAIAPIGFNYVIPAVVIRALALLRIASGYASMWVGHNDLLARIAGVRLLVFSQLENNQISDKAFTTEALSQHTEELASRWVAWIAPLSSVVFIFASLCGVAIWLNFPGASFVIGLFAIWLGAVVLQGVGALTIAKRATHQNKVFRQQTADFFNNSAIWHLDNALHGTFNHASNDMSAHEKQRVPSAAKVWHYQIAQKQKAQRTAWWFQGGAFVAVITVMSGVFSPISDLVFLPIAIVVPMILLASPDWAGAAFHSISKFAQYKQSVSALKKLKTTPITVAGKKDVTQSLTLSKFGANSRRMNLVNATLPAKGIVCICGPSGCGKSSLLQSIAGLLPATGQRVIDGVSVPEGLITNWRYVEQEPIVLSGSVVMNLNPAGANIDQDEMFSLLDKLGLNELLPLTSWVGKAGRTLSGGERKRLALARALLTSTNTNANVLLIDEPFEGLDIHTQQRVCEVLNSYSTNKLVLIASHVTPNALNVVSTIQLGEASIQSASKELGAASLL
ncbi:ATP-binding cassette domain-containing protein [Alteromonas gracilis]|uniref:ATP-binding cassette domain-containing protein n=1 Tax=Alteromonas gracilis TaxID=1479524 RepID=UPI00373514E6